MTAFIPIGENSTFDNDSEIVELFVKWSKDRYDRFNGSALLAWYSSMIAIYLIKAKEFLYNPENPYIGQNEEKLNWYQENFDSLEDKILSDLKSITLGFEETATFSVKNISDIFYKIYSIVCVTKNHANYFKEYNIDIEKCCILANVTGFFSYNTYLYAYVNDIYLIGFPAVHTVYHGKKKCPTQFIEHDLDHDLNLPIGREQEQIAKMYNLILTKARSKHEKEMCIFSLWFYIHELYRKLDYNLLKICDMDQFEKRYQKFRAVEWSENLYKEFAKEQPYIWQQIQKYTKSFDEERYSDFKDLLYPKKEFFYYKYGRESDKDNEYKEYSIKIIKLMIMFESTLCELEQLN